jgi:hypothetical protein
VVRHDGGLAGYFAGSVPILKMADFRGVYSSNTLSACQQLAECAKAW